MRTAAMPKKVRERVTTLQRSTHRGFGVTIMVFTCSDDTHTTVVRLCLVCTLSGSPPGSPRSAVDAQLQWDDDNMSQFRVWNDLPYVSALFVPLFVPLCVPPALFVPLFVPLCAPPALFVPLSVPLCVPPALFVPLSVPLCVLPCAPLRARIT